MKLKFLMVFMCVTLCGFSQERVKNSTETMYLLDAIMMKKMIKAKKMKVHKVTSKTSLKEVYLLAKESPNLIIQVTHKGVVKYGLSTTISIDDYRQLQDKCQKFCRETIGNCKGTRLAIIGASGKCYCGCLDFKTDLDSIIDREDPF
ncbi:hypothetical protein KORDIASMS9_02339 [Kordia sp. SMS9]|uniref:hypothetical protein n=1 Tax=Kordia sp. SMS9 TaxID=2282170 RepID=UPI000E10833F|nr:hypothetical protein [Kordia sp. SMS9]AXG70110.1 hypothetical protein KORDIASMS9_02339 [Kordia sp. SMS9]